MGLGVPLAAAALSGALLGGAAASPAAPVRDGSASAAEIESADRIAIAPLQEFERRGGVEEARHALAAARDARDRLESARVADRFAAARREELAFFNHLVPGFEAYLARPGAEGALGTLKGIVARGRRHRELAREALRKETRTR
ncbi:MAG TPA: hypothetical protein VIZ58_04530 [Thermoanaerobaculia bacterium]